MPTISEHLKLRYGDSEVAIMAEEILTGLIFCFPELSTEIINRNLLTKEEFSDYIHYAPGVRSRIFKAITETEKPNILNVYNHLNSCNDLKKDDILYLNHCIWIALDSQLIAQDYEDCCKIIREQNMRRNPSFYTNPKFQKANKYTGGIEI